MKLELKNLKACKDFLPAMVYEAGMKLADNGLIQVAKIDPAFADGQLLHEHYETPLEWELNCIIVEARKGESSKYAAVLLPYGKRINTGSTLRHLLEAKKVSFAPLEKVKEMTGMEFGAIGPLGLPVEWPILIDEEVFRQENIIIGGGKAAYKIFMPTYLLRQIPEVKVSQGLCKE